MDGKMSTVRVRIGQPGQSLEATGAGSLEHIGLATAVALAVDELLPEDLGFFSRFLVGASVVSLVLLVGQGVSAATESAALSRQMLAELEALRAWQVTQAMEPDTGGSVDDTDDQD